MLNAFLRFLASMLAVVGALAGTGGVLSYMSNSDNFKGCMIALGFAIIAGVLSIYMMLSAQVNK